MSRKRIYKDSILKVISIKVHPETYEKLKQIKGYTTIIRKLIEGYLIQQERGVIVDEY